ncbi:acyltransferase family protein [Cerasicoccus maritimus]|uniref:acyltransferase family protein n=1 Tax=Cerasicoccus maritimus TaxID=490089 RepID=UPI0028525690|nr:acyltransferase [Cerasicoccus maritimus]
MLLFRPEKDLPISIALFGAFATALAAAWVLQRLPVFRYLRERSNRYETIDGLRGYLATMVFVGHFYATHSWKNTGQWELAKSVIAANLGTVGVSLFFMISGFLFVDRIVAQPNLSWARLYNSRLFRIYPLYLVALCVVIIIVLAQTNFTLAEGPASFARECLGWLFFGSGDINGLQDTRFITGGVQWTLRYEWLFYLSLPLVAWCIRRGAFVISCLLALFIAGYCFPQLALSFNSKLFILFVIGALGAKLIRLPLQAERWVRHPLVSLASLAAFVLTLHSMPILGWQQLALMSAFFWLTLLGNDLFGLLRLRSSILLGELSYSIYLLHGILLYLIFTMLLPARAIKMPINEFLPLLAPMTIFVVITAAIAFLLIEHPAIKLGKRINLFCRITRSPKK